jgi:hypothetical protein
LNRESVQLHPDFEIRITLEGQQTLQVDARTTAGKLISSERWVERAGQREDPGAGLALALDQVFELRADFSLLGAAAGRDLSFQVSVWSSAIPLQVVPQDGWLTFTITEEEIGW